MRSQETVVRCVYDEEGETAGELIRAAFAAFLRRALAGSAPEPEEPV